MASISYAETATDPLRHFQKVFRQGRRRVEDAVLRAQLLGKKRGIFGCESIGGFGGVSVGQLRGKGFCLYSALQSGDCMQDTFWRWEDAWRGRRLTTTNCLPVEFECAGNQSACAVQFPIVGFMERSAGSGLVDSFIHGRKILLKRHDVSVSLPLLCYTQCIAVVSVLYAHCLRNQGIAS